MSAMTLTGTRMRIGGFDSQGVNWITAAGAEPTSCFLGFKTSNGADAEAVYIRPTLQLHSSRTVAAGFDTQQYHWIKANGTEPASNFIGLKTATGGDAAWVEVKCPLYVASGRTVVTGFDSQGYHWIKASGTEPTSSFLGFKTATGADAAWVEVKCPLNVDGNGTFTGTVTTGSSREYKDHINRLPVDKAVEALMSLVPVEYNYKENPDELELGFIAEDVPELVARNDRKSLSPMDFAALSVSVIQELKKETENQQQQIEELKALVTKLMNGK
jgi:hypothetical protein